MHDTFVQNFQLEAYIQHFNVSDPFLNIRSSGRVGKNFYGFGRSIRADGTESIVISAPLYLQNNVKKPNILGISNMMVIAYLAKRKETKNLFFYLHNLILS